MGSPKGYEVAAEDAVGVTDKMGFEFAVGNIALHGAFADLQYLGAVFCLEPCCEAYIRLFVTHII